MAFSTQKDFLRVAFMNERPKATCLRMDALALKTYASSYDERAWSLSNDEHSHYLVDLVECRMYSPGEAGDGFQSFKRKAAKLRRVGSAGSLRRKNSATDQRSLTRSNSNTTSGGPSLMRLNSAGRKRSQCNSFVGSNKSLKYCHGKLTPDIGDDSVIHAALETIIKIERL